MRKKNGNWTTFRAATHHMKKFWANIILVFFALCHQTMAQEPAYLHYSVSDGLPGAMVYCAIQDSKGYLWFGTDKGLARFDGTRFKVYGMKDGLPDLEVINLFEDSQERLWISCFGKTPVYLKDGKITTSKQYGLLSHLTKAGGYNFMEDTKGNLWISGFETKSYKITKNKVELYQTDSPIKMMMEAEGRIYGLSVLLIEEILGANQSQRCFVAPTPFFDARSLERYSGSSSKLSENKWGVKGNYVSMAFAKKRILYAYKEGLLLLEIQNGEIKEIDRWVGPSFVNVTADSEGRFWGMMNNGGVLFFDHFQNGLKKPQLFLPQKRVSKVMVDRQKNLFFTTLDDGVFVLPHNAVQTYRTDKGLPFLSNNFTAVNILGDGTLVIGDNIGNLYFREKKGWRTFSDQSFKGFSRIRQLQPLSGNDWIAITDKAIFSNQSGNLIPDKVIGAFKSVCVTKSKVWLGTSHYLINWSGQMENPQIALSERAMTVQDDAEGNVWVGGLEGLASEKDAFKRKWGDVFPPLSSRIIDIEKASNGGLWVATPEDGLLWLGIKNGEVTKVEVVNKKLEAPIENIQYIHVAKDGTIWLATNKGVFSLSNEWKVSHYDQTNGLSNNDVNALVVQEDTLWAATVSGLSKVLLRQKDETGDFATQITALSYVVNAQKFKHDRSESIFDNHEITLPSGTTMLEVELAALYFHTRGNMRYTYVTHEKPLPIQWLTFGNLFNAMFGKPNKALVEGTERNFGVNIEPGRYLTTVTALSLGNKMSAHPDQITLTVLPYWWQTVWVFFGGILIVVAIFWRLLRARDNYLKMLNVNSELQLQAIRAQMNPHFVGNSINAIQQFFYPPDPVKASEYISIFSDLLRRTMYFSETDFIGFDDELNYIKDYLEMIKLRFGGRFSFSISGSTDIPIDTPFPAMLLQPVLENATIHGLSPKGNSHASVKFEMREGWLNCSVTDNGVGITAARAKKANAIGPKRISKGIALLEKKIQTLNQLYNANIKLEIKDLTLNGNEMHGTQVTISFMPLSKKIAKIEHQ